MKKRFEEAMDNAFIQEILALPPRGADQITCEKLERSVLKSFVRGHDGKSVDYQFLLVTEEGYSALSAEQINWLHSPFRSKLSVGQALGRRFYQYLVLEQNYWQSIKMQKGYREIPEKRIIKVYSP